MSLKSRDQDFIHFKNAANVDEEYDILANFPFTS